MWITVILALIRPILIRILTALGLGVVTYLGADFLVTNMISQLQTSVLGISPAVLQIVSLFGVIKALSIILGAFTTSISVQSFKRFGIL